MKNILQKDNQNPDIQSVKAAMKETKDLRLFKRYQAILLYLKERPVSEISRYIGTSEKTIYNYVSAYKSKGLNSLIPGQSPGRPRR
ncbi:helix-turn-helix domain-containing protein, partial [Lentibacillus kapialis]